MPKTWCYQKQLCGFVVLPNFAVLGACGCGVGAGLYHCTGSKKPPCDCQQHSWHFSNGYNLGLRELSSSQLPGKPSGRGVSGAQLEARELWSPAPESSQALGGGCSGWGDTQLGQWLFFCVIQSLTGSGRAMGWSSVMVTPSNRGSYTSGQVQRVCSVGLSPLCSAEPQDLSFPLLLSCSPTHYPCATPARMNTQNRDSSPSSSWNSRIGIPTPACPWPTK